MGIDIAIWCAKINTFLIKALKFNISHSHLNMVFQSICKSCQLLQF